MFKLRGSLLAASAVLFFSCAAAAADNVLLALNTPVQKPVEKVIVALAEPATAQVRVGFYNYTDFDAFSSVDDPLYREGAKEMLKQVIKEEEPAKEAPKAQLRDAPISKDPAAVKPAKPLKKLKSPQPVQTDPVKSKSAL